MQEAVEKLGKAGRVGKEQKLVKSGRVGKKQKLVKSGRVGKEQAEAFAACCSFKEMSKCTPSLVPAHGRMDVG